LREEAGGFAVGDMGGKMLKKEVQSSKKHKGKQVESLLVLDGDGGLLEGGGVASGLVSMLKEELNHETGSVWVIETGLVLCLDGFDAIGWQGALGNTIDHFAILLLVAFDVVFKGKIHDGPVVSIGVVLCLDGGLLPLEVVKGLHPDLHVVQHTLSIGAILDAGLDML